VNNARRRPFFWRRVTPFFQHFNVKFERIHGAQRLRNKKKRRSDTFGDRRVRKCFDRSATTSGGTFDAPAARTEFRYHFDNRCTVVGAYVRGSRVKRVRYSV